MDGRRSGSEVLARLRARIEAIEGRAVELDGASARPAAWRLGIAPLDDAAGGLRRAALHAFRPQGLADIVATQGFQLAVAAAAAGPDEGLLWVTTAPHAREWGRPYGPGLARFGVPAERLLVVEARPGEAGWAIEEGLKSQAFAAVLATGCPLDFAVSRRLALAAAGHDCPCLAVDAPANTEPLAATTIWRVTTRAGAADPFDPQAPRLPAWRVELLKARGGRPGGPWELGWDEAAHRLALAAAPADRAAPPRVPARRADAEPLRAERGRAARA